VNIDVAERHVGEEIGQRAQRSEFVKEPLDAAAGEAKRDLAVAAPGDGLTDPVDDLREDRVGVGAGDGADDAQPSGFEREPSTPFVGIDDQPDLLAPHGTADVVVPEEIFEEGQGGALFDSPDFAAGVDDEGVGGA
jgi:hypothetical protein